MTRDEVPSPVRAGCALQMHRRPARRLLLRGNRFAWRQRPDVAQQRRALASGRRLDWGVPSFAVEGDRPRRVRWGRSSLQTGQGTSSRCCATQDEKGTWHLVLC